MCRSKSHGGRRCPCSSPERQRAYRAGRKAREYAKQAIPDTGGRVSLSQLPPEQATEKEIHEYINLSTAAHNRLPKGLSNEEAVDFLHNEQQRLHDAGFENNTQVVVKLGSAIDARILANAGVDLETERAKTIQAIEEYQAASKERNNQPLDQQISADVLKRHRNAVDQLNAQFKANYETLDAIRDALRQEISRYTALGGDLEITGSKHGVSSFQEAAQFYPTTWIEQSNDWSRKHGVELRARATTGRAHYQASKNYKTRKYSSVPTLWDIPNGKERYQKHLDEHDGNVEKANAAFLKEIDPNPRWSRKVGLSYYEDGSVNPYEMYVTSYDRYSYEPKRNTGNSKWEEYEDNGRTIWRREELSSSISFSRVSELTTYSNQNGKLEVQRTSLHELAHRMEHTVDGITSHEHAFLTSRIADGEKQIPIYGKSTKELGYKDSFIEHYMGKTYNSGHTEIMSMGMESVFGKTYGGLLGLPVNNWQMRQLYDKNMKQLRTDHEYRHFVIGMLTSADAGK